MGTGDQRRQIKLKPIYVALGAERAAALPGFHSLTGSDTTGHIKGKGSHRASTVFMKADEDVICALSGLGAGVPQGCCLDVKSFCVGCSTPGFQGVEKLLGMHY